MEKRRSLKWHNELIYTKNGSQRSRTQIQVLMKIKSSQSAEKKEIKDRLKPNCSIWTDYLRVESKCGSDFITASLPHNDNVLGSCTNSEMWDQILQWKPVCSWGRQNILNLSWTWMLKSLMSIGKVTRNIGTSCDTILQKGQTFSFN